MSRDKVTALGASAVERTRGYVLNINDFDSATGSSMRQEWETRLGVFHVLADGTVLLRLNRDAITLATMKPYEDEMHVEMSDADAMETAKVFLKLSHAAERRRKLLDGRAGFRFEREGDRWWVSHDGEAMALRTLKTRPVKPDPRVSRLDFDAKTSTPIPYDHASRRKCAACKSVLSGAIYVGDKSVPARLKLKTWSGRPMWSACEFCATCVEAPKRTGLSVVDG